MKAEILAKEFYQHEDPLHLGEELLACEIISRIDGKFCSARIVELEIYKAPEDKGSHAYNNLKTKRTSTIFKAGGIAYVYLCYGLHHMFNIVSGPEGSAHAILIRALQPIQGLDHMEARRNHPKTLLNISNGPGKLCQAMGIKTDLDGIELDNPTSPIVIQKSKEATDFEIVKSPRVGIAYAEECAHWPWRFYIKDNPWVSKPLIVNYHSERNESGQ